MSLFSRNRVWILLAAASVGLSAIGAARHATAASPSGKPGAKVTFARDVAPILVKNCASCHRPGEIAPFSLLTYADAKKRAAQIADVTATRFMPPWHAESHGEFVDECKLSTEEIGVIKAWAAAGAPEGDHIKVPAAVPANPTGWSLGKPDLVLELPRPYKMAAEGGDVYRCFVLPTGFTEDTYIAGLEVHPGNTRVVHHVIAYLDAAGSAKKLETAMTDGQPGYLAQGGLGIFPTGALGGWAPGNMPHMLPEGVGTLVKKGSDVVLQIHYHADGKVEPDQSRIGLYFAKKGVDKRLRILPVFAPLNIPAGEAHYQTTGNSIVPLQHPTSIIQVMPHMHLLGKSMVVTANMPDKSSKTLVNVPAWDFNWQTNYMYRDPVKLPAGSSLALAATYDNSTANPHNPSSPPRQVGWGEATTDEMCIAFVWYTIDSEHISQGKPVTDLLDMLGGLGSGGGAGRRQRRPVNPAP